MGYEEWEAILAKAKEDISNAEADLQRLESDLAEVPPDDDAAAKRLGELVELMKDWIAEKKQERDEAERELEELKRAEK